MAFDYNELWRPLAMNHLFVTFQMLWPLPQITVTASRRRSKFYEVPMGKSGHLVHVKYDPGLYLSW